MEKQTVKAKVKEFEINDPAQPFKDDKLERKEYAEILTGIVETFVDGAVIALNGAWGTGKTSFLKMWSQHLKNQDFPIIYYNAWEDDISEEPMLSMLRELKELNKEDGLDDVFRTGAKVVTGALIGAFTAAAGAFGEIAKGAVEGGMKQLEDSVYESLKEDNVRTELMQEFKKSLTDYMTTVCDKDKPLVYMVDELDRCNPAFAVKVLERIKHLFDVPNVVFVLSIDKKQLACSVKGFYGSNEIDADEYLRRFIDYDYYLPEPNPDLFCEYLYDYYAFDEFLKHYLRIGRDIRGQNDAKANYDKKELLFIARTLVKLKHLSLRQIERVYSTARIGLCGMPFNIEITPQLFFFLSYLKVCEPIVFEKISSFDFGLQEFVDLMEKILTPEKLNKNSEESTRFHYLMAVTLQSYFVGYKTFRISIGQGDIDLYKDSKLVVTFNEFNAETITKGLSSCYFNNQGYNISIIIQRLKLLEKLSGLPQTYGEIKEA